ncbi:hypothetical protein BWI97_21215 [Siphonobacter sp. BAB-5405]|uniref:hypothetical protein n=1 Tax=Siphonobacter sp. BAB-5405 TaxID=1864825 RepID=UPI000C7FFC98|nr:hypothetical protein [Siphonobacter sp. BAB-5405]PMD91637.1 hypothetical protein BWI97_21215 [Siphonobacter sp. BAB-5405]
MEQSKEYVKSLDDEIDWKIIDQLHSATLNFSTTSLELKKLLIILVGICVPSLIKLAGDKLDTSLFITIYLLSFTFWFLDSFTYFFQEKLREKMDKHFGIIKARNADKLSSVENENIDFTLDNDRTSKNRFIRSIFNVSISLYIVILILNTFAFVLYATDIIK